MFEHKRYNKITNTYDHKNLKGVKFAMLTQGIADEWVVTEKIHGSNFACYVNVHGVQFASRNNLLNDDESDAFYNFRSIRDKVTENVKDLFYELKKESLFSLQHIIVYGELFGGMYEHKDVSKVNQSRVQKGVQYCPDLQFKVFDIFLHKDDDSNYLNPNITYSLCSKLNIDVSLPLFEGKLDQCLEYQNDFNSKVYKDYSLPDVGENVCEGVVIKPITPFYDNRGNRAIFKNKNQKFSEKAGEKKREPKPPKELSEEDRIQVDIAHQYITMNRLDNLESKLGKLEEPKQIGQFIKGFMLDVIEDVKYEKDIDLDKPARIFVSKKAKELIMDKLTNG